MTTPAAGHPGNDYYVNLLTGTIQRQGDPVAAEALKLSGWAGPFDWATAKSVAQNHSKILQTPNPNTPAQQQVPAQIGAAQQSAGIAGAIAELGAVIKAFLTDVTDLSFWRSIGWILLGAFLIGFGLIWWNRGTITRAAGTVGTIGAAVA